jgi:hypothetical protein
MPSHSSSRSEFLRTLFASLGAAVAGGFAGLKVLVRSEPKQGNGGVAVVRESRAVSRRDLA